MEPTITYHRFRGVQTDLTRFCSFGGTEMGCKSIWHGFFMFGTCGGYAEALCGVRKGWWSGAGPPRAAGCGDPERSGGSEHPAARGGPAERNHPFRTEHNAGAAGARDKHEKTVTNALETHWSERQTSKNVSHTAFGASFPFSFYSFCLKRYLSLCMTAIFVWHDNFSFGTCQTL